MPGTRGLAAGGLDGVGHAVVLAGLPDDRVGVVLAAVVDGDADAEGEGGLALGEVAVADAVSAVGGHPIGGVEPVKGPLGLDLPDRMAVVVVPVPVTTTTSGSWGVRRRMSARTSRLTSAKMTTSDRIGELQQAPRTLGCWTDFFTAKPRGLRQQWTKVL